MHKNRISFKKIHLKSMFEKLNLKYFYLTFKKYFHTISRNYLYHNLILVNIIFYFIL